MKQFNLRSRHWIAVAIGGALLATGTLRIGTVALGQDQSAATPTDVIFARKILMGSIGENMDEIEAVIASGDIDLAHVQSHADNLSIELMVFPHLFPPASNEWKAGATRDPGVDTFAAPDVWTRFADFYKLAAAGTKAAYEASRARNKEDFKKAGMELRQVCDACHAQFLKKE
jgi:cytochrome c556